MAPPRAKRPPEEMTLPSESTTNQDRPPDHELSLAFLILKLKTKKQLLRSGDNCPGGGFIVE